MHKTLKAFLEGTHKDAADQVYVELPPSACLCFQAEAGTVVDEEEEEAVESAASA